LLFISKIHPVISVVASGKTIVCVVEPVIFWYLLEPPLSVVVVPADTIVVVPEMKLTEAAFPFESLCTTLLPVGENP
jgi:hypothetical protein